MSDGAHAKFLESIVGATIGGRYVVEKVLGSGGMGVVAAGRHPELDQPVAIKFMWPEYAADDGLAKRFLREGRVAAKVQSPHLVRVFDVGRLDTGVPYLVMEMLHGKDLDRVLEDHAGGVALEETLDWFLQALVGLAEIHAVGIVHRDLKPSNLFLCDTPTGRIVKVLDFGISKDTKTLSEGLTSTETLLGTPQYMSPEQIKSSKNVDRRSDVWALGVILYELVTGKPPFRSSHGSDGYGEIFGLVLFKEPELPSKVRPGIPLELEAVILKCLRKNPDERFQTVGALATALSPLVNGSSQHRIQSVRHSMPDIELAALASEPKLAVAAAVAKTLPAAIGPAPAPPRREGSPVTAAPLTSGVTPVTERSGTRWIIGAAAALATVAAIAVVRTFVVANRAEVEAEPAHAVAPPVAPSSEPAPPPPAIAPLETVAPIAAAPTASAAIRTPPHMSHADKKPAAARAVASAAPAPTAAAPSPATLILDRK